MKSVYFLALVAVALWLAGGAAAAGAPDVHAVAQAVDSHYDHLRTLQADFTELYSGAGAEKTETGTLWLKKPGKMRWEYRSPKDKLFVSDGKNAWFYVPDERQVRKTSSKELNDLRSPLAFLLGKTRLEKELLGLSIAPDVPPVGQGDVVLRGVPQSMADRVKQVLLEITPDHWIGRLVVEEVSGSTTEYRFINQRENVEVPDSQFQFRVPSGVEVVNGDLGQ